MKAYEIRELKYEVDSIESTLRITGDDGHCGSIYNDIFTPLGRALQIPYDEVFCLLDSIQKIYGSKVSSIRTIKRVMCNSNFLRQYNCDRDKPGYLSLRQFLASLNSDDNTEYLIMDVGCTLYYRGTDGIVVSPMLYDLIPIAKKESERATGNIAISLINMALDTKIDSIYKFKESGD